MENLVHLLSHANLGWLPTRAGPWGRLPRGGARGLGGVDASGAALPLRVCRRSSDAALVVRLVLLDEVREAEIVGDLASSRRTHGIDTLGIVESEED